MHSRPTPHLTLVIPAFNEAALLPRLLDSVDEARRRYRGGPDAIEVIVADNASTDGTADLAQLALARAVILQARSASAQAAGA